MTLRPVAKVMDTAGLDGADAYFEYSVQGKTYRLPNYGYRVVIHDFHKSLTEHEHGVFATDKHSLAGSKSAVLNVLWQALKYKLGIPELPVDLSVLLAGPSYWIQEMQEYELWEWGAWMPEFPEVARVREEREFAMKRAKGDSDYDLSGPSRPGRLSALRVSHSKSSLYGVLYGRAGRLTAQNGGLRPGFRAVQFRLQQFSAVQSCLEWFAGGLSCSKPAPPARAAPTSCAR
jgi:hypothetical protein